MYAKKIDSTNEAEAMIEATARLIATVNPAADAGELSQPLCFYVEALRSFEQMRKAAEQSRAEIEPSLKEVDRPGAEYLLRCDREDALLQIVCLLERLIRVAECRSLADIKAKMEWGTDFLGLDRQEGAEDYATEVMEVVRSLAVMFRTRD